MYVSLVGRSNVGKSCLFNSILAQAGKASNVLRSIVSENPGTTRDSKHGQFYMRGNKITLVDTGGFEAFLATKGLRQNNKVFSLIEQETFKAVENSNLVFFVLDGLEGVTPLDMKMGQKLRDWISQTKSKPEVKLVINKLENKGSKEYYENLSDCLADCYSLEFGDPIVVSAHQKIGIEKLTNIIKSKIQPKNTKHLEEMAIISGQYIQNKGGFSTNEGEFEELEENKSIENPEYLEEIQDLKEHYEIEKSLRVCSSVKGSYKPNERWIKLLNNVCGIPFISHEDDKIVVPSILSPSERLANLYLPDKSRFPEEFETVDKFEYKGETETKSKDKDNENNNIYELDTLTITEIEKVEKNKDENETNINNEIKMRVNNEENNKQENEEKKEPGTEERNRIKNEERTEDKNKQEPKIKEKIIKEEENKIDEIIKEKTTRDEKTEQKKEQKTKTKIKDENVINPINIFILGSKDSNRDKLLSLLCDNYNKGDISDLSPNWHSFYSQWPLNFKEKEYIQPVEIVVSAPLNLGGSLGKMSILQTLTLLRKCDFVLFCVDNTQESRISEDGSKKITLSKREISWLSRAVRFHKPMAIAALVGNSHKNCKLFLTKDYPLSFEFQNVPIIPIHIKSNTTTGSSIKSIDKLKRNITNLIYRGKQIIDTSTLNAWLRTFITKWPPPWKDGSKINLKFAAQVRTSPPTFVLWSNVYATFPKHYLRQLKLALSEEFGFLGIPLKFVLKTTFKATPKKNRLASLKLRRKLFN